MNSQVENSPKISTKSMYWKTYLNFENIPSIGVLKVQICPWFNQLFCQICVSMNDSKLQSSAWIWKYFCDKTNKLPTNLAEIHNPNIPSTGVLKVQTSTYFNQCLSQVNVTILHYKMKGRSMLYIQYLGWWIQLHSKGMIEI